MNKKSIIAVLLIVLMAAISVLGLPFMTHIIEQNVESITPMVTATPQPNDGYGSMESIEFP